MRSILLKIFLGLKTLRATSNEILLDKPILLLFEYLTDLKKIKKVLIFNLKFLIKNFIKYLNLLISVDSIFEKLNFKYLLINWEYLFLGIKIWLLGYLLLIIKILIKFHRANFIMYFKIKSSFLKFILNNHFLISFVITHR